MNKIIIFWNIVFSFIAITSLLIALNAGNIYLTIIMSMVAGMSVIAIPSFQKGQKFAIKLMIDEGFIKDIDKLKKWATT